MKKTITIIIIGILVVSILLMVTGCSGGGITGRWESESNGQLEYYIEFNSDGTCSCGSGSQGSGDNASGTYTLDNDGTLHITGFSSSELELKQLTVDEMLKSDNSSDCYACDGKVLYYMDNKRQFTKK